MNAQEWPAGVALGHLLVERVRLVASHRGREMAADALQAMFVAVDDHAALDVLVSACDKSSKMLVEAWWIAVGPVLARKDGHAVAAKAADRMEALFEWAEAQVPEPVRSWCEDVLVDFEAFMAEIGGEPSTLRLTLSLVRPGRNATWVRFGFSTPAQEQILWAERELTGVSPTWLALSLGSWACGGRLRDVAVDDRHPPPKWLPPPLFRYHPERFRATRRYARLLKAIHPVVGLPRVAQLNAVGDAVVREYNARCGEIERRATWKSNVAAGRIVDGEVGIAFAWCNFANAGRQIFEFTERLTNMLRHSDAGDIPIDQIRLPYPMLYLRFGPVEGWSVEDGWRIDGCYIEHHVDAELMTFLFTAVPEDPERVVQWAGFGEPTLHLAFTKEDRGLDLGAAIDTEISRKLDNLREDRARVPMMQATLDAAVAEGVPLPQVTVTTEERAKREEAVLMGHRQLLHQVMSLAANALCYLTAYPDDTESQWPAGTPAGLLATVRAGNPKQRQRAKSQLESMGYTKVHVCGSRLTPPVPSVTTGAEDGRPLRSHWRRGHWRRQPYGEGRALRKLVWLMPVLVGAGDGEVVGHIYRAD